MLKIKHAIAVEGTYDKIKLSQLVDTTIVVLDGFMIYKNKKMQEMLKRLADTCGLIIFTDSDMAGFRIRTFLKNILKGKNVVHAYIPDVVGKEKRKAVPSKEGFLGVEGMTDDVIIKALNDAVGGLCKENDTEAKKVTKTDLFADGFSGGANSAQNRQKLIKILDLPHRISANMLLDVINNLYSYEEYKHIVSTIKLDNAL
ncbi:MAG: DUF4093 domain-containing protein [Clostridia bacterium]|nr:DUF4093 domain-containing protein [Clostridia bacterium]